VPSSRVHASPTFPKFQEPSPPTRPELQSNAGTPHRPCTVAEFPADTAIIDKWDAVCVADEMDCERGVTSCRCDRHGRRWEREWTRGYLPAYV